MSDDVRLDLLKDAIAESDLDGQTKDALADDLRYAQEINGAGDAALRGIKRIVISGIRRELLAHDRTKRAIGLHVNACPGSKFAKTASAAVIEQPHGTAKWILLLTPWRWPVALACFSPFIDDVLEKVFGIFAK